MTKTLKEQAIAHTPKHGVTEYKVYSIKYPIDRVFVYDGDNTMVWSCESMTEAKAWIDAQDARNGVPAHIG